MRYAEYETRAMIMNIVRFAAVIKAGVCVIAMVACATPIKSVNNPIVHLTHPEALAASFGTPRPQIMTNSGVREPQNRRVEIRVH